MMTGVAMAVAVSFLAVAVTVVVVVVVVYCCIVVLLLLLLLHRGSRGRACGSSGATRAAWRIPFAVH